MKVWNVGEHSVCITAKPNGIGPERTIYFIYPGTGIDLNILGLKQRRSSKGRKLPELGKPLKKTSGSKANWMRLKKVAKVRR